ncbi:MAG: hypothetical protein COV75_04850 [Candidatus Omnitrophica bacterium CG11_big_fil_rev_8_21_14_0_20_63_9]|nr:MAG: hypothetical protein COV75_04850 [Candidatus Omnitrophica bacterium CG11_big_fil_rev_8_21_14_0_20_63_9]
MTITDPLMLGTLAGLLWSLANVWGLARLSTVWLRDGASRTRTLLWFFIKFPCLYAVAIWLLLQPAVSPAGFGIGFTLVLIAAIVVAAVRSTATAHGQ